MLSAIDTKKYDEQRYERLKEIISEYLDDDGNSATRLLDDLQKALLENIQYFQGRVDAYTHIQDFFK